MPRRHPDRAGLLPLRSTRRAATASIGGWSRGLLRVCGARLAVSAGAARRRACGDRHRGHGRLGWLAAVEPHFLDRHLCARCSAALPLRRQVGDRRWPLIGWLVVTGRDPVHRARPAPRGRGDQRTLREHLRARRNARLVPRGHHHRRRDDCCRSTRTCWRPPWTSARPRLAGRAALHRARPVLRRGRLRRRHGRCFNRLGNC